jgi:hypothetical protein
MQEYHYILFHIFLSLQKNNRSTQHLFYTYYYMDTHKIIQLVVFSIIFLSGLVFYAKYGTKSVVEGFDAKSLTSGPRCPNILIQKGAKYYLYNSNVTQVPGVNPIAFNNLEEYVEFLEWQRAAGIRCPVLYVQNTYDVQGERVYKIRPSVTDLQGGLPPSIANATNPTLLVDSNRNDPPYNRGQYPSHDQTSYYVGTTTPLDVNLDSNMLYNQKGASDNPMDPNWGGADYTEELVESGYYKNTASSLRG